MNENVEKILQEEDSIKRNDFFNQLDPSHFSLMTFVDTLIPSLVWENNLRHGNFHLIKMSLFLRNLARRQLFGEQTERALAQLIMRHIDKLTWTRIVVETQPHMAEPIDEPVERMLSEMAKGNAHNAFFYALTARQTDKYALFDALMQNGAVSIADTLGHSISCFFPVLTDVLAVDHPDSGTCLLSLIMYLCRYHNSRASIVEGTPLTNADKSRLMSKAASGRTIVDLHHMITFYTLQAWEAVDWHTTFTPPWQRLADWMGEKHVDASRESRADRVLGERTGCVPATYEDLQRLFLDKNHDAILDAAMALLAESYEKTCDWLFRIYAEFYTPDWNPHYVTSLYAALELYRDKTISTQASMMAFIQALEYFLESNE